MLNDLMTTRECTLLRSLLDDTRTAVLCCHQNPDGDAMGSLLGMAEVLRLLGKEPLMVNKLITEKTATVQVLDTTSKWFGVTYAADREGTVARIKQLVEEGVYPEKLF